MSYESVMDADFDQMTEVQRQILEVSDADEQVLTFTVGDHKYCVDIEPVSEVLWNEHDMAEVPDMDPHVVGVANLRGRSVRIIDPKIVLDMDSDDEEENLILFEPDEEDDRGYAWLVDTVEQVLSISHDEIDESVADDQLRGLIERDEELIMWVADDCFTADLIEEKTTEDMEFKTPDVDVGTLDEE